MNLLLHNIQNVWSEALDNEMNCSVFAFRFILEIVCIYSFKETSHIRKKPY